MAPPVLFEQLTQLWKGPDVTAPRERKQEEGCEKRDRPAWWAPPGAGYLSYRQREGPVEPKCWLLSPGNHPPPPPNSLLLPPECWRWRLLILLEKFQVDWNVFWQELVPSECQFRNTCTVHVSKNLSHTPTQGSSIYFLGCVHLSAEKGCDSVMLLLFILFFSFFHFFLSVSSGASVAPALLSASDQPATLPHFQPVHVLSPSATHSSLPDVGSSTVDFPAGGRSIYRCHERQWK